MAAARSPRMLLLVAGYGVGAALYSALPDEAPFGRPLAAFLLPTAALVTDALLRGLIARHPIEGADSPDVLATYDAVMLRLMLFLMGVHVTVLVGLLGLLQGRQWAARIVPVFLGLTMVGIGNLLPRTRPNLAIGIRTSRTLSNRALWAYMHRIAGYALVGLGLVVVAAGMALPPPVGPGMIQLVAPAGALGLAVLLLWSKRHADGIRP